jgi:signal transduction histidine kinase
MKKAFYYFSLFAGIVVVMVNVYGFFLLSQRPGLPPEIKNAMGKDQVLRLDGIKVEKKEDVEFLLSRKSIGTPTRFTVQGDREIFEQEERLVSYYTGIPYPLLYFFIGLIGIFVGLVVFVLRPKDQKARIFYWATVAFSSAMTISGGFYCLRDSWTSYIPGIIFYIFYPLAPALFLHFSLSFGRIRSLVTIFLIYVPSLIFIVLKEIFFLSSSLSSSMEMYRLYQSTVYAFRFYLIVYLLGSIFLLIHNYIKSDLDEHRAQIKWVLLGFCFGLGPFIFLYQLPRVLRANPLFSEELAAAFLIVLPFAFAFSIVKFKLMDVELIINRSLVYSILTVFTVSVYLIFVQVSRDLVTRIFPLREGTVSVLGALVAAVAFHPARKKIQEFVDKSFFRVSYDYKRAVFSFNERAQRIARPEHLVDFLITKIQKTLPLEYLGLFLYIPRNGKKDLYITREEGGKTGAASLKLPRGSSILAKRESVQTEQNLDFSKEDLLQKKNAEMIIPLLFPSKTLTGYISLGRKRSGGRFTQDDIELLRTFAGDLALNLERMRLQEEVVYEKAEKEKLDDLNRLKTEFISSVSHEIRTPMSSIQGISEILQGGKIKAKEKQDELLRVMGLECGRLSRFLRNILDFGKIEQKDTIYHLQDSDLCSSVDEITRLYRAAMEKAGFSFKANIPKHPIFLRIDKDAVKQALTNVLDNAIKYAGEKREINILLLEKERNVEIHIKDKGIGIPAQEQGRIFEAFYRAAEARQIDPRGVGLGLKIVKHIMDAHKGKVQIQSLSGKGSTFILVFPKHEKDTDH